MNTVKDLSDGFISGASLPPDPCIDVQTNCKSFGQNVCVDYAPWAKDNCARFCGICIRKY